MKELLLIFGGIALTVLCWGVYGPVLHQGQLRLGENPLKPLICVGVAYFLVAIVVPTVFLASRGDLVGDWKVGGIIWSMIAGSAGALGALGIIIALSSGGNPVYVMPIVFGCAPVVNVLFVVLWSRSMERPSPLFYAGLILVAVGAAVVLIFKPRAKPDVDKPPASVAVSVPEKNERI